MPSHVLQRRAVQSLPARIAASATTNQGVQLPTEHFDGWLAERRKANTFRVDRIPFAEMEGWSFQEHTGNLVHRSGRFFTVEGLHFTEDGPPHGDGPHSDWYQPIMRQHEVGVLGILVKEFDGVLHFLMQAKMEPGNPNLLQLSPTVQATRSNYTKAHQGGDVKYIEHFVGPDRGRVIVDVRQSEHGSWFSRKSNRNMVVEAVGDVPLLDDFCWLTLGQINELLHRDNVINMDSRTVLSCLPTDDTSDDALLTDTELLSWITGERTRHCVRTAPAPLDQLPGWKRRDSVIEHETGRYFNVVAVSVQAGNREVTGWTQPLFEPADQGVLAFLTREIEGTPHVLVQARVEPGLVDTVELAPTVQYTPHNYAHLPEQERPPFTESVLHAAGDRIRYDVVHAEEGGRFLNAENRCLIVEADAPLNPPPGYAWVTRAQLTSLVQHSHYLNVQARTMLACLNAMKTGTR
ncbi:NDP-hexose 2,3-dehydratase family protein [Streptomyces longispororuber]|uniref:NDP-hexose 2,3-dehydratase family protein n=1 Tax=Streptomyces longispororuber TaxID=68230 RepID=UPI00210D36FB|nr:NDP-hexose 2,3-dehydratase family protein [Streptomyces longispororuber]MCQ4205908.1 NDP-hexose 2,3-dehydratase family protein [Streptomyces longispororuber]